MLSYCRLAADREAAVLGSSPAIFVCRLLKLGHLAALGHILWRLSVAQHSAFAPHWKLPITERYCAFKLTSGLPCSLSLLLGISVTGCWCFKRSYSAPKHCTWRVTLAFFHPLVGNHTPLRQCWSLLTDLEQTSPLRLSGGWIFAYSFKWSTAHGQVFAMHLLDR